MKTNMFMKAAFLIVILSTVSSCLKDEVSLHDNYFTVGNELKISLVNGYIIDYGLNNDSTQSSVYHMHADFLGEGITFNPTTHQFFGAGNRLNIEFNAAEDHHLTTGTYLFEDGPEIHSFTFRAGFIEENYNFEFNTGHKHQITGGTVIVIYDGYSYDFTFNCTLDTGSSFIGTYKGTMTYNDAIDLN